MKPKILPDIMAMVRLLPLLGLLLMYSHQIVAQTSSATITTDKDDYAPGETAIITGTGWWPGETVELDFEHIEPNIPDHVHVTKYVTADESGNIYFEWYVDEQELGTTFHLMARGQSSGYFAETFFTDGNVTFSVSGIPPSHSVTVSYKFRNPTGANNDANSTTSSQQTTFTIGARNNSPVKFSYQTVSTSGGINYHLSNVGIDAGSLSTGTEGYQYEFQSPSGARTVTANYGVLISTNKTATYGGSVTLTSSFYSNYQTSTGIVGKPITFYINGTAVGTVNTQTGGVASLTLDLTNVPTLGKLNAGTYDITTSFAGDSELLPVPQTSSTGSTLTVDRKALTVTADNQSKTYGDTFSFDGTEFSTAGLVNSDAVSSATIASDGAAATATVDGAPYAINISAATGTGLSNYDITYVPGSFAVGKKALTVTADNQSKTYGDTFSFDGTEFSASGLVNSDAVSSATITSDGAAATATVDGAPYAINISAATGTGLSNYDITYVPGSFAVGKKALTVTADDKSKYCGQDDPELTYQITSGTLVNGDGFTGSLERESGDAAGTYKISQGSLTLGTNYDLTVIEGEFTINAISSLDATQTFVNIQINNTGQLSATISPAVANVPVTFTIYHDDNVTVLRNIVGNTNASGVATVSWTAPGTIGVYKVDVMAGSSACDAKMEAYVTVFDPSDSFVTGGGWINSPAGAMPDRPDAEGRANFGFVSRYKKGRNNLSTNEVDGNTEFQFQAGDLNFKSTLHESGSLVISGARATYRGTGTINGQPGFRFMVVAIDGDWNGQRNPDRFRIKITTTNGTVIYDNQIGKAENTDDATVLGNNGTGGGSIVIHEVKGKGPNKNVMASMIEVPWNTPVEVLEKELQQMASSWFEGEKFAITLDPVDYNPLEPGFYQVGGYFENNPWFERNEIIPVPVMVLNKAMAQDILIDNNLMGKDLQAGTVVGRFSTVDAVDNIHTYSIEENPFFVIENNNLVWRGIGTPDPQVTLRVSSTDRAGQTISRDIQLFRETGPNSLLIYPNPAMKETNLLVNLAQESDIEIRIFDAAGRLVFTEDSFQKESFVKNINLDQLSQGLYHVVVKVNHQYIQGRLVKQ